MRQARDMMHRACSGGRRTEPIRVLGPPCHLERAEKRGCWHRYRQDPGSLPGWAAWQYRWGFLSWHSWFGFGERGVPH